MAGQRFRLFPSGPLEDFDYSIPPAARQPLAIRADGDGSHAITGGASEIELLHIPRPAPELDFAVAARGEEISIRAEREGVHHIAVGRAVPVIAILFEQLRVRQAGDELAGGQVVDENLVRPPAGC